MGNPLEKMDFKTIQKLYPEQWVLIGNPEMIDPLLQAVFAVILNVVLLFCTAKTGLRLHTKQKTYAMLIKALL